VLSYYSTRPKQRDRMSDKKQDKTETLKYIMMRNSREKAG
jgi:hypothetical protein